MRANTPLRALFASIILLTPVIALGQDRSPWDRNDPYASAPPRPGDSYRPPAEPYGAPDQYGSPAPPRANDAYRPPATSPRSASGDYGYDRYRDPPPAADSRGYGGDAPPRGGAEPYDRTYGDRGAERGYGDRGYSDRGPPNDGYGPPPRYAEAPPAPYSQNEILNAGHSFFGSISKGVASAIEYAFQEAGRPNGYILGEDAGGAFVAGLRYGEGTLFTKDAGSHRVYWQGPSLGYDFGGEGSKTMVLVYNLRDISEIYNRFGGVQGSAYVIGGVSIQFQKYGDVVLAPIRAGVGLRLGANVGYLKYTRTPTWNPF